MGYSVKRHLQQISYIMVDSLLVEEKTVVPRETPE